MASSDADRELLREAIRLSLEKMQAGEGGPFGAVIARDGGIIARGWNRVTSANDPTAHAEIEAVRAACSRLKTFRLSGYEIYCSCEPCPMCLGAIHWARLDRIHFAASVGDAAEAGFDDLNFRKELAKPLLQRSIPEVQSLRDEALAAFESWIEKRGRVPY